jgi:hypothetical protein
MLARRARGVGLALVALMVSGCATGPSGDGSQADRVVRGIPEVWSGPNIDPLEGGPVVGWIDDDEFAVVTMGSGSCPPVAREPEVVGPGELRVTFGPSPHDPCTADMSTTTHVFALPAEVTDRPVTITVTFEDWNEEFVLELP